MKLRFIYVLFFSAFAMLVLQSRSGGVAANMNQDRTGSPVASGTCSGCHSGGVFGTAIGIVVKNGAGTAVTTYTPGVTYSVEFNVTSGTGFTYAMQGVALTATNTQGGAFGIPTSTNTQVTALSGREYVEHSSPATGSGGFSFIVPWVAPASGTGSINFYGIGLTANGNGGTSGDQVSVTTTVSLTEAAVATTIDYANTSYCANGTNPTPVITGTTGGTFTASPAGLSISSTTGEVNVGASTVGAYTVTYTYGAASTTTDALTVVAADNGQFTFAANSWCQNDPTDPSPQGGPFTGTWSGTTGLSVNAATGVIDLSATAPGNYAISYVTNGACPDSNGLSITITAPEDASFVLNDSTFCQNGTDGTSTITGTAGGTFTSAPSGLTLNASTGAIDVSTSTPGAYMVTYTTSTGVCGANTSASLTVGAPDDAQFTLAGTSFCQSDSNVTPVAGASSGTWSGTTGLSVDPVTGTIDFSASTAATHMLTFLTNGLCPDSNSLSLTVLATDVASFAYTDTVLCIGTGVNPFAAVTGTTTGTYTSAPAGLVFADNATGEIDGQTSTDGTYVVTYTSSGQCPIMATVNVELTVCSGLNTLEEAVGFSVYPNPNNGLFTIGNNGPATDVSIQILDVLGKVVYQQEAYLGLGEGQALELTNLSSGTYFVQLQKGNQQQVLKLNIQ